MLLKYVNVYLLLIYLESILIYNWSNNTVKGFCDLERSETNFPITLIIPFITSHLVNIKISLILLVQKKVELND